MLTRRLPSFLFLFAFGLLASGCATGPTPYVPMSSKGEYGHSSETRPSGNVVIRTVGRTRAEARDMALLRAAELASEAGKTGFVVIGSDTRDESGRTYRLPPRVDVDLDPDGYLDIEASTGVGLNVNNAFKPGRIVHELTVRFAAMSPKLRRADEVTARLSPTLSPTEDSAKK